MKNVHSLKPRRFGIELEISRRLVCASYSEKTKNVNWTKINALLANLMRNGDISHGWKLKTDTSCGGELVSPPIIAPSGLNEIALVASELKNFAKKAKKPLVDGECGVHIHLDAHDYRAKHLSNLFVILHMAEPIIYAMYPNRNFEYCAPISLNMNLAARFRDWTDVRDLWYRGQNNVKNEKKIYRDSFINSTKPGDYYDGTRYHGFNIHCYWRQGTVEFRYGNGTFDINHIKAYYEMCLAMANTAAHQKSLKMDDALKSFKYRAMCSHYNQAYRFRKYLKRLCKLCGFSRDTIKLMTTLIAKNSPDLLNKDPKLTPIFITESNKKEYVFVHRNSGQNYNADGTRGQPRLVNRSHQIECEIKRVTSDDKKSYTNFLVPINPKVVMDFEIKIKTVKQQRTETGFWNAGSDTSTTSTFIDY